MRCGGSDSVFATVLCATVLAGGLLTRAYGFAGGTGEPNDPYQIATTEHLLSVGLDDGLFERHFVLIDDIDLDPNLPGGRVFEDALIARDQHENVTSHLGKSFTGLFDGQGHTIWNLSIAGQHGHDAGLFGMFSGVVKDLHLRNVHISGSPVGAIAGLSHRGIILRCSVIGQVSGSESVGGMVGSLWTATVMDCRAEVQVTGVELVGGMIGGGLGGVLIRCESCVDVVGDEAVGGLVGELHEAQIVDSRVRGMVVGRDSVGGLVGNMPWAMSILRSTAACVVVAEQTSGGLVGATRRAGSDQGIVDSYARGSVAGSVAGGLIGTASDARIVNSYVACEMIPVASETETIAPAVGGLFGQADTHLGPLVVSSFWDSQVSGVPLSSDAGPRPLGAGLDTEQMQQRMTFEQAGWDFDSTWAIPEHDYPVLQWELAGAIDEGPIAAGRRSAEAAALR